MRYSLVEVCLESRAELSQSLSFDLDVKPYLLDELRDRSNSIIERKEELRRKKPSAMKDVYFNKSRLS